MFYRNRLLLFTFIVILQTILFIILSHPESTSEDTIRTHLTDLEFKLQYLDLVHKASKKQALQLFRYISKSSSKNNSKVNPSVFLDLPSSLQFLPHLTENESSLKLGYLMSQGRSGVTVVIGVPTVRRQKQYLIQTLKELTEKLNSGEADETLIVVFVAETDSNYVVETAKNMELFFPEEIRSGLIEVLSPSPSYYPKFDSIKATLGDSLKRVKWRSKQNLDYAYLMAYCQTKGAYYLQLEDDIQPSPNYMTFITRFVKRNIATKTSWFVLEFCQLGFIGKLFKSSDLPLVIQFLYMFYSEKPSDWILEHLVLIKGCNWDIKETCERGKTPSLVNHRSLFQHIGTISSLDGKTQTLKDPMFSEFYSSLNPNATVSTTIQTYNNYTIDGAYIGESVFWGIYPSAGDQVLFNFTKPVLLKGYLFRSGSEERPSDKFYDTTVEVLPVEEYSDIFKVAGDGYLVLDKFKPSGLASRMMTDFIQVKALRLFVRKPSNWWVILREIYIVVEN